MTVLSDQAHASIVGRLAKPLPPAHELTVTISGKAGAGKTSLACLIERFFVNASGVVVDNRDPDCPTFPGRAMAAMNGLSRAGLRVTIKTKQLSRAA